MSGEELAILIFFVFAVGYAFGHESGASTKRKKKKAEDDED